MKTKLNQYVVVYLPSLLQLSSCITQSHEIFTRKSAALHWNYLQLVLRYKCQTEHYICLFFIISGWKKEQFSLDFLIEVNSEQKTFSEIVTIVYVGESNKIILLLSEYTRWPQCLIAHSDWFTENCRSSRHLHWKIRVIFLSTSIYHNPSAEVKLSQARLPDLILSINWISHLLVDLAKHPKHHGLHRKT